MKKLTLFIIAILFLTPISANAATVGLWLFDEGTGNITYDSSDYDNDGTIYGAMWTTDDKWNNGWALDFDGVNDWVEVPHNPSLNLTGNMTIEFWMKPDNWYKYDGSYTTILMKGTNEGNQVTYNVGHPNSGDHEIKFTYYNGGWVDVKDNSGVTYTNDEWYHMGVIVDEANNNVEFYRNGIFLSSIYNDFNLKPMLAYEHPLVIGRFRHSVEWFDGTIDEVRISNVALNPDELGYDHSFVPEPASMILLSSLATGLFGIAGIRRKFSRR